MTVFFFFVFSFFLSRQRPGRDAVVTIGRTVAVAYSYRLRPSYAGLGSRTRGSDSSDAIDIGQQSCSRRACTLYEYDEKSGTDTD